MPPPPPAPGTWRGLVVAPESRCSEYDLGHYRDPDSLEEVEGGLIFVPLEVPWTLVEPRMR
ncbi:hypothetical protein [Candidatus Palauibacter sp.]|uniref:hypothetical protein n=1 Tax=Candidatus Palauibacter sp. TaxID=3101350 RepID=UPI003B51EB82